MCHSKNDATKSAPHSGPASGGEDHSLFGSSSQEGKLKEDEFVLVLIQRVENVAALGLMLIQWLSPGVS